MRMAGLYLRSSVGHLVTCCTEHGASDSALFGLRKRASNSSGHKRSARPAQGLQGSEGTHKEMVP